MTGYQEILTDPSYAGQIVTLTYPHIGNIGVNAEDVESRRIFAAGLVIRDLPRSRRAGASSGDLVGVPAPTANVVGIADIDTRRLTRILREKGAQNGCIVAGDGSPTPTSPTRVARARGGAVDGRARPREGRVLHRAVRVDVEHVGARRRLPPDGRRRSSTSSPTTTASSTTSCACSPSAAAGITVVPAQTPARDVLALKPDGVFLSQRPRRSRALRLRDRGDPRDRRRRHADVRHLPRPPAARPRVRRAHAQDEVRPSRRQSSGARQGHGPGADHQPEPRLRRRSRVAAGATCASRTSRCSTAACRASRAPTSRRSASRAIRRRAPARTTSAYLFDRFVEADGASK